jgi:YihY family inner membrane protein
MGKTTWARKRAEGLVDRIEGRLPRSVREAVRRARTKDVFLFSASLAFYAIVSVIPLTILVLWLVSMLIGDQRVQQLAGEIGRVAPKNLGADRIVERVAQQGSRLGAVAALTALWPATAYGSGLERAFDRLGPKRDEELEGLRGRALFFLVLLPVLVLGSLVGSFVGSVALGSNGVARVVGYVVALGTGFLATSAALVLIYRIFPPSRLSWRDIFRATVTAATGISVLSFLLLLFVSLGTNFEKHYATSGLALLVLLAVWLFLANVLVLVGYRVALET